MYNIKTGGVSKTEDNNGFTLLSYYYFERKFNLDNTKTHWVFWAKAE